MLLANVIAVLLSGISKPFFLNHIYNVSFDPPDVFQTCAENWKLYTPAFATVILEALPPDVTTDTPLESAVLLNVRRKRCWRL